MNEKIPKDKIKTLKDQSRVLVSCAKILASFNVSFGGSSDIAGSGASMVLPEGVLKICKSLEFTNLNVGEILGELTPCDASLSFSGKLGMWMVVLPTVAAAIYVSRWIVLCRMRSRRRGNVAELRHKVTDLAVVAGNTACFLLWPAIGRSIFEVYTFVTVEEKTYLSADMGIESSDAWWSILAAFAGLGALGYIVLIPVAYLVLLHRTRRHHRAVKGGSRHWVERRFSSLYLQ